MASFVLTWWDENENNFTQMNYKVDSFSHKLGSVIQFWLVANICIIYIGAT